MPKKGCDNYETFTHRRKFCYCAAQMALEKMNPRA